MYENDNEIIFIYKMLKLLCFSLDSYQTSLCEKYYQKENEISEQLIEKDFFKIGQRENCYNPTFFLTVETAIISEQPDIVVIATENDPNTGTYFHSHFLPSYMNAIKYTLLYRDKYVNNVNKGTTRMSIYTQSHNGIVSNVKGLGLSARQTSILAIYLTTPLGRIVFIASDRIDASNYDRIKSDLLPSDVVAVFLLGTIDNDAIQLTSCSKHPVNDNTNDIVYDHQDTIDVVCAGYFRIPVTAGPPVLQDHVAALSIFKIGEKNLEINENKDIIETMDDVDEGFGVFSPKERRRLGMSLQSRSPMPIRSPSLNPSVSADLSVSADDLSVSADQSVSTLKVIKNTIPPKPMTSSTITSSQDIINFNALTKQKIIGQGAQGTVYLYTTPDNNPVAVKEYMTHSFAKYDVGMEVLRELNAMQRLKRCEHINQLYDVNVQIKPQVLIINIVTPFYKEDLTNFMETVNVDDRIQWVEPFMNQLLSALNQMYYTGIVHMDIKPDNIMLDDQFNLTLIDFGLSLQLPCDQHKRFIHATNRGTPLYMAPELLTNQEIISTKADVWGAGLTLLEFLVGKFENDHFLMNQSYPGRDIYTEVYRNKEYIHLPEEGNMNNEHKVALIYQILRLTDPNYPPDFSDFIKIKNNQLDAHIDVEYVLNQTLTWQEYSTIPSIVIDNLTKMLQINPLKRPNSIDLHTTEPCPSVVHILERGDITAESTITSAQIYAVIYQIIDFCQNHYIQPSTCYMVIDLVERYVHNTRINNIAMVAYAAGIFILFMSKMMDSLPIKMKEVELFFSLDSKIVFRLQFKLLKDFHYLLTTCETDEIIYRIHEYINTVLQFDAVKKYIEPLEIVNQNYVYPSLKLTYQKMQQKGLYCGNAHPVEFEEIFDNQRISDEI